MTAETITTISPTTNTPVAIRHGPSDAEMEAMPTTAASAFRSWSMTELAERQALVKRALQLLRERQDALAKTLTEEMGRPIAYGAKEVATAALRGEYMLRVSSECLADTPGDEETGFRRYIRKTPLGPVLVLFAWNYPWLILANSLFPALLAGDTVILKPSPQTPSVAEQAQKLCVDAGVPKDVVQVLHCGDFDRLRPMLRHPSIKLICFTGSVAGGLSVQQAVSDKVAVRVGLELGGKDPAYVRSDVDVAWAAEEIVDGAIFNSGQSCCALERIYVDSKIHDQFVTAVQHILEGYRLGDPADSTTQIGPVVSKKAMDTIASHVQDALSKGAKDATPANDTFVNLPKDGNFVSPRLLIHVTHDMTVMKDETFGPIIPVMKVSSDEEAIQLMNDSQFGLTASIWTKDTHTGNRLADGVDAGTVFINRADYPSPVRTFFNAFARKANLSRTLHGLGLKVQEKGKL
ncbi:MAG: hypothetical protein Q9159_001554 [Coniocarpon cinnabarinum]